MIIDYLDSFTERDWDTDTDGTIRFALIGLGWWTRERAIPALAGTDYCETAVTVSSDKDQAETLAADISTVSAGITYEEFHDGAATDAYDAIYIATPNALHLPYVEAAADHGKQILCEKPMEATADRAEAMVEVSENAGVTLMIGYRMQTDPAIRRSRELIRDGFLGTPTHVHGTMTQRLLEIIPDPDQWRLDPDLTGPGTSVTDLGIYPLNTARFVLDDTVTSVTAQMHTSNPAFDAVPDERASFTLEFDSGVLAVATASQNTRQDGLFSVTGTDGTITLSPAFFEDDHRTLTLHRNGTTAGISFDKVDQMREEFDYFAHQLLTNTPVHSDGRHGLTDVRIIEAIYEAAAIDARVSVET